MKKRQPYILTHEKALAYGGEVLALDPAALGKALTPAEPAQPLEAGAALPTRVAIIRVNGALCQRGFDGFCGYVEGYDTLTATFVNAIEHPQIGAVVLVIDSPGGDVAGLFEAVRRMNEARVRTAKPVFAYADELIASAAYALATVATAGIYAPLSAEVGSIGVVFIHCDATAANEKDGLKFTIIRSGERKFEGSPLEPLGDVARMAMQERVDELAVQFIDIVAASRGLTADQVRAFKGACFSGRQAVTLGLANGIASLEEVLTMAAQAAGVPMSLTPEEQEKMDALEKENAELKARLESACDGAEGAAEGDEEEPAEPAEDDEEEAPPAAKGEVAKLKAELAKRDLKDKATALVDAAAQAGKVEPAKRKELVELGMSAGIPSLKVVLAALPVRSIKRKADGPGNGAPPTGGVSAMSALEKLIAKQMNIPEADFAAHKAKLAEKEEA